METPYFIIYEQLLEKNINDFKTSLSKYWPNSKIAYSIKTNSLPWILKYMRNSNIMAEAVSDEEYQLAKLCGYEDNEIVFNGPIKSNEQLQEAIKNNAIINIDSNRELNLIKNNKLAKCANLGLRINIEVENFSREDVDYRETGFRFGFSEADCGLSQAIDTLKSIYGNLNFGLHLHCNSITRSIDVYKKIAEFASSIVKKYKLTPSYIDIGGGFFGGLKDKPSADQYLSAITKVLSNVVDTRKTQLIIEPGSAFVGSVVDLHTSVIDAKYTNYARIVTTDGSRIHIDPFWKKSNYTYSLKTQSNLIEEKKQIICGYTCMDHDRIMTLCAHTLLNEGDKIIYHQVGAYTITFGGPFIKYFPDVYVVSNDKVYPIRKQMSVKNYYEIQTNI